MNVLALTFVIFGIATVLSLGGLFLLWSEIKQRHPKLEATVFPKANQPSWIFAPAIRVSALLSPERFGLSAFADLRFPLQLVRWSAFAQVVSLLALLGMILT